MDWSERIAKALAACDLTPEEKDILSKARMIRAAHLARMEKAIADLKQEEGLT